MLEATNEPNLKATVHRRRYFGYRTLVFFLASTALLCASGLVDNSTADAQETTDATERVGNTDSEDTADAQSSKKSIDPWEALNQPICCGSPFEQPLAEGRKWQWTRGEIRRVINPKLSEVEACADKGDQRGKLLIRFTILPGGTVTQTAIETERFAKTAVGKCAVAVVKTFEFRKLEADSARELEIVYPFEVGSRSKTSNTNPAASENRDRDAGAADSTTKPADKTGATQSSADKSDSAEPQGTRREKKKK
jgi:hypothetical protein